MTLTNLLKSFQELENLSREFENIFGNIPSPFRAAFLPLRSARMYPLINVTEDKDAVYVEALAPGLDIDNLEITVVGNTLRIAGEKQALSEEISDEAFHRAERGAGRFIRTFELPVEVDSDKVSAEYVNGLLKITLPKAEEAKPKLISVKVK